MWLRGLVPIAVVVGGCYEPEVTDCQFRCGNGNTCPDGTTCRDGFCRTATAGACDPAPPPTCPQTYTTTANGCFRFIDVSLAVAAAETECELDGAHLAVIESAPEAADGAIVAGGQDTWIGLVSSSSPTGFVWITGEPLEFALFGSSDPSGEGGCVRTQDGASRWDDEPCTAAERVLCELDGKMPTVAVPPM